MARVGLVLRHSTGRQECLRAFVATLCQHGCGPGALQSRGRAVQRRLVRSRIDGKQKIASANLVSFLIGHASHIR